MTFEIDMNYCKINMSSNINKYKSLFIKLDMNS